ncbi:hypothetical protein JTE90_013025 [Oedothorax gibbosus]|uniref:CCDC92/74 N-terminal domain-containing protein n=1 Tax=Oedothorax gibbosus TaxID=931172 RepID=A0AAV6UBY6_9ARAC|nr:hypothetical protein JTE90_013025 [Oedothorax gibbosus]
MSRSEVNSEVQVARPGQAFPFSSPTTPPHPHISQWCRFTVPERLPLQPFRQDRLNRLPLPPSIMATSKVATMTGTGNFGTLPHHQMDRRSGDIDPFQKIQQLEKSLIFVRENHAFMLKGLHEEISELKQKNRELLFELVTGIQAIPKDLSENPERDLPEDQQEKVEKLEKEVRKLRGALKDAIKANSSLSNQLQDIRREQYNKYSSRGQVYSQTANEPTVEEERPTHSPCGPSPQMEEYSDTLRQIQRASMHGKRDDRRHHHGESKQDWSDNYSRNGYHHHRHHHHRNQSQKSPQQHQPRLPRLPLRNQQNYSHPQYEIQYRQRSTNSLPALKPLVPVVEHGFDKPRKQRGPRPPKMADQVING